MEQELDRLMDGNPSLGDQGRICRRRRMVRALLDAIEGGDTRAAKLVLDRVWAEKNGPSASVQLFFDAQGANA